MKIRTGYVSNSSSSSFIIIGNKPDELEKTKNIFKNTCILAVNGNFGNCEFGWEFEKYTNFGDKVIFAYIQAKYMSSEKYKKYLGKENSSFSDVGNSWLEMLEKVLKENLGVVEIKWELDTESYDGELTHAYIDHQSASYEGENISMFDDEESLVNFLFSSGSSIHTGNDNE